MKSKSALTCTFTKRLTKAELCSPGLELAKSNEKFRRVEETCSDLRFWTNRTGVRTVLPLGSPDETFGAALQRAGGAVWNFGSYIFLDEFNQDDAEDEQAGGGG